MDFEDYNFIVSEELLEYILSSYPLLKTPKRLGKDNYVGFNHKITSKENINEVTSIQAKDLFYKDIKEIENYTLIKSIKNKIDKNLYEVLIHFTFDYGKSVLKNSKFYFYVKENNTNKVLEELEKYKNYKNTTSKKNANKRSFDVHLITNNRYKTKDINYGNKKRSSSKNVGFRF